MAELIKRAANSSRNRARTTPSELRDPRPPRIELAAVELLQSLPASLRLVALRGQFPRILNRVAQAWSDPPKFAALIDSLLIDHRGNREGFPFEVVKEITELRRYYFSMVHPEWRDKLDADSGRPR